MSRIFSHHYQEWLNSAVAPSLIKKNVISLEGSDPHEFLLYSEKLHRRNDGRLSDNTLKKYQHLEQGGWFCGSLDPHKNWKWMEWGQIKPDSPRFDEDGDSLKYESPPKAQQRLYCLDVSDEVWEAIARRHQVELSCPIHAGSYCFWDWLLDHPAEVPIILTEGSKKNATILSTGFVCIALPGITMGWRSEKDSLGNKTGESYLHPDLLPFCHPSRTFRFAFDQDSKPQTRRNIRQAIKTTAFLLKRDGGVKNLEVIEWDKQKGKGVDDLIAAHGQKAFEEAVSNATPFAKWSLPDYYALTYSPSLRVNERYLTCSLPESKFIAIRSDKGTGKTELIAKFCQEAMRRGQPTLLFTHREQLAREISGRIGIPYRAEIKETDQGKVLGYTLCFDSLHAAAHPSFHASDWSDPLIITDECEQAIWHLLDANTQVKHHRVEVIDQFQTLINQGVVEGNGQIVAMDADLSDLSINFIKGLSDNRLHPWLILNDWRAEEREAWKITSFHDSNPASWYDELVNHICEGGKPFIFTGAASSSSPYSTVNIEHDLKKRFPHLKPFRIDQQSLGTKDHPAYGCMGNLNSYLENYDIVICSPSIETGVSIDIQGHFTAVFACSQGNLPTHNFRQALARIREPIPRYIYTSTHGFNYRGGKILTHGQVIKTTEKKVRANIDLLNLADLNSNGIDSVIDPVCQRTWAKMAARQNQGMWKYRDSIEEALVEEGHHVHVPESLSREDQKEIHEKQKESMNEQWSSSSRAVAQAPELEEDKQIELESREYSLTQSERYQLRKARIGKAYQLPVSEELVQLDDLGWRRQLLLHYYLSVGREHLASRDQKILDQLLEEGNGQAFKPDVNKSMLGVGVAALEMSGIKKFLEQPNITKRKSDPNIQEIATWAVAHRQDLKEALGITIKTDKGGIYITNQLLNFLGYALRLSGRDGSGARERTYCLTPCHQQERQLTEWMSTTPRQVIFGKWLQRESQGASKHPHKGSTNEEGLDTSKHPNNNLLIWEEMGLSQRP